MANMQLPHEHSDSETEVTPELQLHQRKPSETSFKKPKWMLWRNLWRFCLQELESPVDVKSPAAAQLN